MVKWNKIDWFCPDCNEYWMTTENCSPCARLSSWCHCSCRTHCKDEAPKISAIDSMASAKCHACGHELRAGGELCSHFERSRAI